MELGEETEDGLRNQFFQLLNSKLDRLIANLFYLIQGDYVCLTHPELLSGDSSFSETKDIPKEKLIRFLKQGLTQRQVRFVLGSYRPNPKRMDQYDWLNSSKAHLDSTLFEGIPKEISRQLLDNHLRKLVRMRILQKRNGRYSFGHGYGPWYDYRFLDNIKSSIKKAKRGNCWTNVTVTLINEAPFKKDDNDLIDEMSRQFKAAAVDLWTKFTENPYKKTFRSEEKFKKRDYPKEFRFPLVVIDLNTFYYSKHPEITAHILKRFKAIDQVTSSV